MCEPAEPTPSEAGGARERLVARLKELRAAADGGKGVSFRALAKRVPSSYPTLNKAVNGRTVPTWEVVRDFVRGCGDDPADYEELWKEARAEAARPSSVECGDTVVDVDYSVASGDRSAASATTGRAGRAARPGERTGWTGPRLFGAIAAGALVVAVTVIAVALVVLGRWSDGPSFTEGSNGDPITAPATGFPPGGPEVYDPVDRPSSHCTYYHHILNGANVGSAYACTSNASLNTYHVWVICSGSSAKLPGPSVPRGMTSTRDCPTRTHPSTGGFDRDS